MKHVHIVSLEHSLLFSLDTTPAFSTVQILFTAKCRMIAVNMGDCNLFCQMIASEMRAEMYIFRRMIALKMRVRMITLNIAEEPALSNDRYKNY
jgi:hypothetical protein